MRKALLLLVLLVPSPSVSPQSRSPQMVTQSDGGAETLPVSKVEVAARVVGSIAETRITLTFKNPHNRVLEGEFSFPLPEGATISGYALDINGLMVDGVVVEQEEGRRVFEKIVRRGVDPGLAEWVKGNVFRTRVYPIRPDGSRTVMVRYISEIETHGDVRSYRLPLSFPGRLDELSLKIDVVRPGRSPVKEAADGPGLDFSQWQGSYRTQGSWRNIDCPGTS
jgi:Ca-activated chloride channel family protein